MNEINGDVRVRLTQRIEDLQYKFSVETMGEDGKHQYTWEEIPPHLLAVIEYFNNIINKLNYKAPVFDMRKKESELDALTTNIHKIMKHLDCTVDQALTIIKYNAEHGGTV